MNRSTRVSVLGCAISAALAAPAVWSQAVEEVVVTAQRRAETVQEIPIAVTAYTQEELGRLGVSEALVLFTKLSRLCLVDS